MDPTGHFLHRSKSAQLQTFKPTAACSEFRHPWPLPSSIVPGQIAVTMGGWRGGLWEWLDRVAPTPHWPEQQTECTHSGAKDKASMIMCGGTAVCVCVCSGSCQAHDWITSGTASSDDPLKHREGAAFSRMWLCFTWSGSRKERTVSCGRVQLWANVLTDTAAWKYF